MTENKIEKVKDEIEQTKKDFNDEKIKTLSGDEPQGKIEKKIMEMEKRFNDRLDKLYERLDRLLALMSDELADDLPNDIKKEIENENLFDWKE